MLPNMSYQMFLPSYASELHGKAKTIQYPITHQNILLQGSQLKWAALNKEAYIIHMAVTKFTYYLEEADIILHSDHLSLKKFLHKNTFNAKVNIWATELRTHKIY